LAALYARRSAIRDLLRVAREKLLRIFDPVLNHDVHESTSL
jgi:hypothetical protein